MNYVLSLTGCYGDSPDTPPVDIMGPTVINLSYDDSTVEWVRRYVKRFVGTMREHFDNLEAAQKIAHYEGAVLQAILAGRDMEGTDYEDGREAYFRAVYVDEYTFTATLRARPEYVD